MKIYDYKKNRNLCGRNVRKLRLASNMTQGDLAAKVQVEELMLERDSISRIELGTRFVTDYELLVLAKVLGVSMEELMAVQEEE